MNLAVLAGVLRNCSKTLVTARLDKPQKVDTDSIPIGAQSKRKITDASMISKIMCRQASKISAPTHLCPSYPRLGFEFPEFCTRTGFYRTTNIT